MPLSFLDSSNEILFTEGEDYSAVDRGRIAKIIVTDNDGTVLDTAVPATGQYAYNAVYRRRVTLSSGPTVVETIYGFPGTVADELKRLSGGTVSTFTPSSGNDRPLAPRNGEFGTYATSNYLLYSSSQISATSSRKIYGPFKQKGDWVTNSPGDWDRISAAAGVAENNGYMADNRNANGLWNPTTPFTDSLPDSEAPCGTTANKRTSTNDMLDLAFVARTNESKAAFVLSRLIDQAALIDFSDTTAWPRSGLNDTWPIFPTSTWLGKLVQMYALVKQYATSSQTTTLDTWFTNAGDWLMGANTKWDNFWDGNRTDGSWPTSLSEGANYGDYVYPNNNGSQTSRMGRRCNNRWGTSFLTLGMIGYLLNNSTYINAAKLHVKDVIVAGLYASNREYAEFHRWTSSTPSLGLTYTCHTIGQCLMIAHMGWLTGDSSLFTFSTSSGIYGTAGTPSGYAGKSLLYWAKEVVSAHVDGTASHNQASTIKSNYESRAAELVATVAIGQPYWNDSYLNSILRHESNTQAGFQSSPSGGSDHYLGPLASTVATYLPFAGLA